jgi:hypothetical protein
MLFFPGVPCCTSASRPGPSFGVVGFTVVVVVVVAVVAVVAVLVVVVDGVSFY